MKFLTALSIVLIAMIKMGDRAATTALLDADTQRPTTLFSVDSNYETKDAPVSYTHLTLPTKA